MRGLVQAILALVLSGAAAGQSPHVFDVTGMFSPGPLGPGSFGASMAVGDFDRDGFDDLVVMEPGASAGGQLNSGQGWVLFGPTFSSMLRFESSDPVKNEFIGSGRDGVVVGDVDGDGELDLLVGAPAYEQGNMNNTGRAHLFYGPDFTDEVILNDPGAEKHGIFGATLLLLDVTRDGRDDVFIGAPGASGVGQGHGHTSIEEAGQVRFFDATALDEPDKLFNPLVIENGEFGSSIDWAPTGDLGKPLLFVGAEGVFTCCPEPTLWGRLHVFGTSGLDYIQTIAPTPPVSGAFGNLVYMGDLTGDGRDDIVVGAHRSGAPGCTGAGIVTILEGPEFKNVVHVFQSPDPCNSPKKGFGAEALVVDVDRDGAVDVLVSDIDVFDVSFVRLFYGPDYATMQSLGEELDLISLAFGATLTDGDFDGDGFHELAIFAPLFGDGIVYRYDLRTLTSDVDQIAISAGATVSLTFDASAHEAGNLYLALLSVTDPGEGLIPEPGVYVPLAPDAITTIGLSLLDTPILDGFAGTLDADGTATFTLNWPANSAKPLAGQTLRVVAVTAAPDGRLSMGSNSLEIALLP